MGELYSFSQLKADQQADSALRASSNTASTCRKRMVLLSSMLLMFVQCPSICQAWSPIRLATRRSSMSTSGEFGLQVKKGLRKFSPFPLWSTGDDTDISLQSENYVLRDTIRQLEEENQRLKLTAKIVLENFEGEGLFGNSYESSGYRKGTGITLSGDEISQDELWCDELEEDECPIEPSISFGDALRDRALWLVGLLLMQSFSGIILSRNEALLADHPVIIFFLTMLVGAGGNAGNQASVRVIRGLALGTLNEKTRGQFLGREVKMAASLSLILSVAGFLRAILFKTGVVEAIAVTTALALIVFTSVCFGAVLPLLLEKIGVDPAHSSTSIQVIMDILGVVLAVSVSRTILDGPLGVFLETRLGL